MSDKKEITGDESKKLPAPETYPNVLLSNSTSYTVDFQVDYALCSTDKQTVASMKTGPGLPRGVCLVTAVYAWVKIPGGTVKAKAYTSSGTSYSEWACIYAQSQYMVVRIQN